MRNEATEIVWELGDAKQGRLLRLGAALHEMGTRKLVGPINT